MFHRYNLTCLMVFGLILAAVTQPAVAVAQGPVAPVEESAGLAKLDQLIRRLEAYLRSLPALEIVVQQTWRQDGQSVREGGCEFSLRANHDGPFRLEIRSKQESPIALNCVGDGGQITRTYDDGTHRLVSLCEGGFNDLAGDHLTASCLAGSGLDILCRPQIHAYVMSRVSDVRYLGTATLPQGETHRFRCAWDRSSRLELWISAGDNPLPLRQTLAVSTDDTANQKLSMVSDYQWNRRDPWPPEAFEVDIADEFVKVADLYAYLLDGATRSAIGQTAPAIVLPDTRGKQHRLSEHAGHRVMCLFFWATWATASTQQKAEVYRLMTDVERDAVVFYAVNVGESKQTVVDFLKQTGFDGTVLLDADRKLVQALRITSLPVCVLVGKDGRVAAVHLGNTEEDREFVRRDLGALCGREGPTSDQ